MERQSASSTTQRHDPTKHREKHDGPAGNVHDHGNDHDDQSPNRQVSAGSSVAVQLWTINRRQRPSMPTTLVENATARDLPEACSLPQEIPLRPDGTCPRYYEPNPPPADFFCRRTCCAACPPDWLPCKPPELNRYANWEDFPISDPRATECMPYCPRNRLEVDPETGRRTCRPPRPLGRPRKLQEKIDNPPALN